MSDTEQCPDCQAPMHEHEQGYCPHQIESGVQYSRSELTDTLYKVTRWVELENNKIVALQKEPVENRSEQPTGDTA